MRRSVHPHDDVLVIPLCISNTNVRRILVDNGSSINIIYKEAFDRIAVRSVQVKPISIPLTDFIGIAIMPIGSVSLHNLRASSLFASPMRSNFLLSNNLYPTMQYLEDHA